MSELTYTYAFADGNTDLHTKLNANFGDVQDVTNGNLDEDNLKENTALSVAFIEATVKCITGSVQTSVEAEDFIIAIPDIAGSKFQIKDSSDTILFEIDANTDVKIGV